jgi:hypothetical protein
MNKVAVSEDEPDEGNGPIVTIRDNMIAIAIIVVLAASGMFMTAHYQPWQLSSTKRTAHPTNVQTTIGCCAGTSQTARLAQATPFASVPASFGVVVGQINYCGGMDYRPNPPPPAHPAGTVAVLRGSITWIPIAGGGQSLGPFPTETVATQSIPTGGAYRFILPPGSYVIVILPYLSVSVVGEATISVAPYASVSVVAGLTTHQDVPPPDYPCR